MEDTITVKQEVISALSDVRKAAGKIVHLEDQDITKILIALADLTRISHEEILSANAKDLSRMDPKDPKYDRLLLNERRLLQIEQDIRNVAALPSPLHRIMEQKTVPSGLELTKISVAIGVIGIVYEARPNVTFDVFSLCLKSGNCVVLKGGSDAHDSNLAIVRLIREVLRPYNLEDSIYLAPGGREALPFILGASDLIDMIIPRGSQGLIDYVRSHAKVPVVETGAGIVHTYFDKSGELEIGKAIIENAKTRRVSVCNALDTLIIHRSRLGDLPYLVSDLDGKYDLEIFADQDAYQRLNGHYDPDLLNVADGDHFGIEYLSMKMSIKTVDGIEEALEHIAEFSSKHSEAIIATDSEAIETFNRSVDAAAIYSNTSTAYTDGAQFGLGAEIGISTQKLHARGPMGLNELTSYKWIVKGSGQVRP